ncbi:MAG: hypothetical protein HXS46_13305 [Theionarchaea archaeon]|nr:hypothetical protein [Theionarchaea archaeon]
MKMNKKTYILLLGLLLAIFSVNGLNQSPGIETSNQFYPAIHRNIVSWEDDNPVYECTVVWEDDRNGNLDIYGCNIAEKEDFQITTDTKNQLLPVIYENIVVWQDNRNGNWDIYGCNLLTNQEFQITNSLFDEKYPAIHGNIVVWQDNRNGNWDIYEYDLLTKQEFRITSSTYNQQFPAIHGDIVVWVDNKNGNPDIYGYDRVHSQEFQITTSKCHQQSPAICKDMNTNEYTVVWQEWRTDNWSIYGCRLQWDENNCSLSKVENGEVKEFPITTNPNEQRSPAICGDIVVWYDDRHGTWDIYGYNLSTHQEFHISTGLSDQLYPAIYGNFVIWMDITTYHQCSLCEKIVWWMGLKCRNYSVSGYDLSTEKGFLVTTIGNKPPFPVFRCLFLAILPLAAFILIILFIYIYGISEKLVKPSREEGDNQKIHRVNVLEDFLTRIIIGRKRRFFLILFFFFSLQVVTSYLSGSLAKIDIHSLPREAAVLLKEEASSLPTLKDPIFFLYYITPIIIFFPAWRFFSHIPGVFIGLYKNGIIKERKKDEDGSVDIKESKNCLEDTKSIENSKNRNVEDVKGVDNTSRDTLGDFNKSLQEFENKINGKCNYVLGLILCCLGISTHSPFSNLLRESLCSIGILTCPVTMSLEKTGLVNWRNFIFFPVNWIAFTIVALSMFFMLGVFIWKMYCVVSFAGRLDNDYNLELKPYDTDGVGGFKPLEQLWLDMTYVAIPILSDIIILFFLNRFLGAAFYPFGRFSDLLLCNIAVVALLIYPIWNYHHVTEIQKTNFLENIEKEKRTKVDEYYEEIENALFEKDLKKEYMEHIKQYQEIVRNVKSIHSWPFTKYQKVGIAVSAVLAWAAQIFSFLT